jgi:AcrR family transcriptional regulator
MAAMPMHPIEESRREEYSDATRQGLLESARETFAAPGFNATSTEAISRASRVTRGAFYHHFEDKTAIFDAVVAELNCDDPELLGRMVGAMICEVALLLPDAKDATRLRKQALDAVTGILNAFRRETFKSKPVE